MTGTFLASSLQCGVGQQPFCRPRTIALASRVHAWPCNVGALRRVSLWMQWRGAQRSRSDRARARQVPPSGPVVGPMSADEAGPVDVRERMSSILERDRSCACPDD